MALLPTDKKQQNTLAIGLVGLLLAFVFYFFVYKKRATAIADAQSTVETLTDVKTNLFNELQRYGGDLSKQIGIYEQQLKRLEQLIPQRSDVPELLNAIAKEAQIANIAYGGISPVLSEPVAYYSREVYDLQVSGGYHEIGTYLAGLASLPRIIKPMDLKLTVSSTAKPRADGAPTLDARFSIETYVIPAPGEIKADSTKKGT